MYSYHTPKSNHMMTIIVLASLGFLVVIILLAVDFASQTTQNNCPPENPTFIEQIGHFKLPPNYDNLYSFCNGWNSPKAEARFELSPDDLAYFFDNVWALSQEDAPTIQTNQGHPQYINLPDDFEQVTSYLYFCYGCSYYGRSITQEFFIDTRNPETYRVYLIFNADS